MTSTLFERVQRKTSRPRKAPGEPTKTIKLTVPASVKLQLQAAADAERVSLSYMVSAGAIRQAELAYDERELGLVPIPGRIGAEELALMAVAASARGMSVNKWAAHVLLDAASVPVTGPQSEKYNTKAAA